jgi:predicted dehydrogenase
VDKVRVGVVGAGFAAGAHIEALRRLPGLEVTGIAASTPERSVEAAACFGVARAYRDHRELVSSADIDAVHNCSPNHLHLRINLEVLESSKHLLSEKPLGLTSGETRQLVTAADRSDVVTGVCHNYRHYPLVRQAREMLASGEHGTPRFIHGSYLQDWLLYEDDWNWRLDPRQAGGSRAVADIGSHWIDLVQYVTGHRVTRVCARLSVLHSERLRPDEETQTFTSPQSAPSRRERVETEDAATVLLEFATGASGCLSVSQVSPGRKNRLLVMIDTESIGMAWDQEDPNRLWLGRRDAANSVLMRDPALLAPPAARLAHLPGGHEEGWADGLKNLVADFYSAVAARRSGEPYESSFATFSDAHQVTRVVEAVLRSHDSNAWEAVDREEGP